VSAARLQHRTLEKIWGKRDLPPPFASLSAPGGEPIGEIWFEAASGTAGALLVKYLFTSENLSIQVHPNDDEARAGGYPSGKDEAWLVLEAEPGATIALGLKRAATFEEVRSAALGGSLEELVHWQPVQAGDIFYSPAGTVHAIGAGLSLIEIQQNLDLTYRLYDYGRDRELHLEQGLRVADLRPYTPPFERKKIGPGREIAAAGGAFVLERWFGSHRGSLSGHEDRPLTLVMVTGSGALDGETMKPGDVWSADRPVRLSMNESAELLLAYTGSDWIESIFIKAP
jgi:mannose-6-phosphate isomerase